MGDPVPQDTLYIRQGSDLAWPYPCDDADQVNPDTGEALPADFSGGWQARCEVRQAFAGALVTRFHSDVSKGWDGTITLTTDGTGNLILGLAAAKTVLLTKLPRTARFDIELISPSGLVSPLVGGPAVVTLEVTTDV